MKKYLPISILITGFLFSTCTQKHIGSPTFIFKSKNVKDSFDVYITLPKYYKANEQHSVFYYLDANLKSGNKIREILRDSVLKPVFEKTIFVGIGHRGDYHILRRRDFTVPEIINTDTFGLSNNFGHSERFYQFMKMELVPYINKSYHTMPTNNSLLGHSFGGLFSIYSLLRNDTIFKNYYALSPSLWVSNYSIYKFNELNDSSKIKKKLFVSVGNLELLNRIKSSTDGLESFLQEKKYSYLNFKYVIYKGETHNSEVPCAISDILCNR